MHTDMRQQIQEWTQTIDSALLEGRIRDSIKFSTLRNNLMMEFIASPEFSPARDDAWLRTLRDKDAEWLEHLRAGKEDIRAKLLRTRKKRTSLGMLNKAYVPTSARGKMIRRKG